MVEKDPQEADSPGPELDLSHQDFTAEEIRHLRQDTPLIERGRIHLNHAGASPSPRPVLDAVREYQDFEAEHGGYESRALRALQIDAVYDRIGRLVGAPAPNIALVENATVAFSQALSAFDFGPGDVIVTTRNDYVSNHLNFLSLAERGGVQVQTAPDHAQGGVDVDALTDLIRSHNTKLVTLTWIPTNSGLIQPAAAVGERCQELGVPFLVDACQAVGQLPIDVEHIGCDFLTGTGRKFLRGPRGTGFLFVSNRMLEAGRYPLYLDLHAADWTSDSQFVVRDGAKRFENWEFNYSLQIGLGEAAHYASELGLERIQRRSARLAELARSLARNSGLRVLDHGHELGALVTIEVPAGNAGSIVDHLRTQKIHTSWMDRSAALLDLDAKGVNQLLRISPHYVNTEEEIEIGVAALVSALKEGLK